MLIAARNGIVTLGLVAAFASGRQLPLAAQSQAAAAAPVKEEGSTAPTPATVKDQPPQDPALDELRRRLDLLAAELERLRSGDATEGKKLTAAQRSALGLGPAAASVYEKKSGVSFAGYGEMVLQRLSERNQSGRASSASTTLDFLRAVLYMGYRFNDKFLFNSEAAT